MFFLSSVTYARTPSAVQLWLSAEDSTFASAFLKHYEAYNLKISPPRKQNSEIYNEIDTTTLKCQLKIHTSAFRSLTAAMEEDTNQTSDFYTVNDLIIARSVY